MITEEKAIALSTVNVEMLPCVVDGEPVGWGCRLRPYGRKQDTNVMCLGYGESMQEALISAHDAAQEGDWQTLDFAARPWATVAPAQTEGIAVPQGAAQTRRTGR